MSMYSQRLLRRWRKTRLPNEDEELTYVCRWVDDIVVALSRKKGDSDFIMDVLDAAGQFFEERLTDKQKHDAFIYTLGLLAKK